MGHLALTTNVFYTLECHITHLKRDTILIVSMSKQTIRIPLFQKQHSDSKLEMCRHFKEDATSLTSNTRSGELTLTLIRRTVFSLSESPSLMQVHLVSSACRFSALPVDSRPPLPLASPPVVFPLSSSLSSPPSLWLRLLSPPAPDRSLGVSSSETTPSELRVVNDCRLPGWRRALVGVWSRSSSSSSSLS